MIGLLRGVLLQKEPPALLLEAGGVGYEIEAPMTTFYDLPVIGQPVTLYTHLVVREDAHLLYGFTRESQRRLFRGLLKVNGVGPRVALAVLSGMSEQELVRCLVGEDIGRLTKVPGIGRKTAERLIIELRDKVTAPAMTAMPASGDATAPVGADPVDEAVAAMIALGYKPPEATRVVRAVASEGLESAEIIRLALRALAP